MAGGRKSNSRRQGSTSNHATLYRWKDGAHAQRYAQIYEAELPNYSERAARQLEDLIEHEAEVEAEAAERLRTELPDVPVRALPSALRSIATAKGINLDKRQLLRGE